MYHITDNFHCWVRATIEEQYNTYDEREYKRIFKTEVLTSPDALKDYVNDNIMPMVFPNWSGELVCQAIMNSIDWDELLDDLRKDFDDSDSECITDCE
jgi:hypothetical protein